MTERTTEAPETNIAFRGLALDPYLGFSLRSSLLYFSPHLLSVALQTAERWKVSRDGNILHVDPCLMKKIKSNHFCGSQSNVETRTDSQRCLGRSGGLTQLFFSKCILFMEMHKWELTYII